MSKDNHQFRQIIKRAMEFYLYSKNFSEICPIFPDHVHLEPTNMCNLRCVHCHHSTRGTFFTKKIGIMKLEIFKKVIDEIKTVSSRITLNQQGEPTLHPNLLEMVEYAKNAGLSVSLLTNASKLKEEMSERLLDMELDRIVFSFEGSNKDIHEKVRRNSKYTKTLKNILYFIKRNSEKGRKTFICMSMVESSYTRDDVEDYKNYFNSLPINTIFVNPMLSMSGSTLTSHEIDMSQYDDVPKEDIPVCRLPWETVVVNWDGTVSACAVDYNEDHIVGNVSNEPLQQIWNSERMQRFRRCHIEKDYDWIEEQGSLCVPCNCRFNPEYDLRDMDDFVVSYIERQAKVHAPQLMDTDTSAEAEDISKKISKVNSEFERVSRLLDEQLKQ